MKTTYQQREQFIDSLIPSDLLNLAIVRITETMLPEEVFSKSDLEAWAFENGFKKFE